MGLASMMLSLVMVNLFRSQGKWQFYSPVGLLLAVLSVDLLISHLAASGGVLVSLRTANVRQAQQTLLLDTLVLGVLIVLALEALLSSLISGLSSQQILFIVISALVVLDAILLRISLASFHRSKLILS